MAGAIENARLYEEARRRADELEHLNELGETTARAATLEELLPAAGVRASLIAPFALERLHTDTLVSELAAAAVSH